VEFLNPFLEKLSADDKYSVLDILARDEQGRLINIEIQTALPAGLRQRLTYYAAVLYCGQLTEGEDYPKLRPAVTICVLNQVLIGERRDTTGVHADFRLRDLHGRILTDDLQVHLLELPKLANLSDNKVLGFASPAERWGYFLLHADQWTSEEVRRLFPEPEFTEADGVLEMISRTPARRSLYDAREKALRDEASRINFARSDGLDRGELIGAIKLLSLQLGQPLADPQSLRELDLQTLQALLSELQRRSEPPPS
jgi:predicted transposase/invertase (TIGR01784 family)